MELDELEHDGLDELELDQLELELEQLELVELEPDELELDEVVNGILRIVLNCYSRIKFKNNMNIEWCQNIISNLIFDILLS